MDKNTERRESVLNFFTIYYKKIVPKNYFVNYNITNIYFVFRLF